MFTSFAFGNYQGINYLRFRQHNKHKKQLIGNTLSIFSKYIHLGVQAQAYQRYKCRYKYFKKFIFEIPTTDFDKCNVIKMNTYTNNYTIFQTIFFKNFQYDYNAKLKKDEEAEP